MVTKFSRIAIPELTWKNPSVIVDGLDQVFDVHARILHADLWQVQGVIYVHGVIVHRPTCSRHRFLKKYRSFY